MVPQSGQLKCVLHPTTLLTAVWCLNCCVHPHYLPVSMSQGDMSSSQRRAGNVSIHCQSAIMIILKQAAVSYSRLCALQADHYDQQGAAHWPAWSVAVRPLRVLQ